MILQFPNPNPPRTDDHKKRVVIGHLVTGNSLWDLLEYLLQDDVINKEYDEIMETLKAVEEQDPSITTAQMVSEYIDASKDVEVQRNSTVI